MTGPLDGITIVEIGAWVAGPAAGGILADWGAEVIKVEPPSGDPARTFRQILGGDLPTNPVFELDNRSKSSIVVDSRADGGLGLIEELIAGADVFLTNLRPAALKRWGLDHETLCERHPSLVYALLTGYGLEGPDADKPAYDIAAYWARSGIAAALRAARWGVALPAGRHGRSHGRDDRGGHGQCGAGVAGAYGQGAIRFDVAATARRVHRGLRRERRADVGFAGQHRQARDDAQSGPQQLRGRGRSGGSGSSGSKASVTGHRWRGPSAIRNGSRIRGTPHRPNARRTALT